MQTPAAPSPAGLARRTPGTASLRGLVAATVVAALALGGGAVWAAGRGPVEQPGEATIAMGDYAFSPDRLTWRAGESVTVTIVNRSIAQPGIPHEIMFGRRPLREAGVLGPVQGDGFEEQLLDGATVELLAGQRVTMVMADTARLTGVDPMTLMPPGMDMSKQAMRMGMDFMAVVDAGGSLTFLFQVPDRPGDWEFGCFQQDGQHYLNGMRGTVTVTTP